MGDARTLRRFADDLEQLTLMWGKFQKPEEAEAFIRGRLGRLAKPKYLTLLNEADRCNCLSHRGQQALYYLNMLLGEPEHGLLDAEVAGWVGQLTGGAEIDRSGTGFLWRYTELVKDVRRYAGLIDTGGAASEPDETACVSLSDFIKNECALPDSVETREKRTIIKYRVKAIQTAEQKGTIKLPPTANKWRQGLTKRYRSDALRKKWPEISKVVSLPALKK